MDFRPQLNGVVFAFLLGALPATRLEAQATSDETKAPPAAAGGVTEPKTNSVENSVVKVFATVRYPDPFKPWTKEPPTEVTGSGVIIPGKRILSNAHLVAYAGQVQVQANQAGDKISATVEAFAPGIDLAVLKLEDETLFDTHPPLAFAPSLPEIKDAVMVYGYPQGGSSLSITKGIVSRIEFVPYNLAVSGLRIQIDAAINPGNSGGPAVVGDRMIGLAYSHLGGAEKIGYIIPAEEIGLFLQDVVDGHYDGKPAMFDVLQTFENAALRAFLKADKSVAGLVVHKPASTNAAYPLKEWDIITRIGDTPIDDQGMIKLSANVRVQFQYLVQKLAQDGKVPLTVVRAGRELPVQLPVSNKKPTVVPGLAGAYPSYFVYGPMVFSAATQEFFSAFTRNNNASRWIGLLTVWGSPLFPRFGDQPAFEGEELVVVTSPFFPHKLGKGYGEPYYQVVKTVNGVRIKNLSHLVEVLRDSRDEFTVIEFDSRVGETLVFPHKEMLAATEEILTDNGVRSQGTADTLAVWNAKPAR